MARSCNVGLVPVVKPVIPALTEGRLLGVEKGYFHGEGIAAASARLVDAQARIPITADWGGGHVASVGGMRFVVPVKSLHARPSPLYFGVGKRPRGATWLNAVSDKVMGLGGLLVPRTLRDSLYILDAIHRLDAAEHPEVITTDQGSYSDIVYGMFAVCGYQFAPRHADITDTQMWCGGRPDKPKNGNGLVSGLLVAEDAFDDFGVLGRPGSEVPGRGVD